jgi:hypothetical protein
MHVMSTTYLLIWYVNLINPEEGTTSSLVARALFWIKDFVERATETQ